MKKISKIIIAILILNLLIVANVFATEENNNSPVSEVSQNAEILNSDEYQVMEKTKVTYINPLYKDIISEEDLNQPSEISLYSTPIKCYSLEEAGNVVREELKMRNENISIIYVSDTKQEVSILSEVNKEAMKHTGNPIEGDYLMWQFEGWTAGIEGYYSGKYYYTLDYTYTYFTTYEQEQEMDTAVSNLLNTLSLSGTDYEKITTIYDYICNNVQYDYTSTGTFKHTAYAALINKQAVCQGYALLFYRLALENSIDARLIAGTGNGGAHGWNIVEIEDQYYNVDPTWDTNYALVGYRYYMLTDENFIDHERYAEYTTSEFYTEYPMGEENYTAERNELDKANANKNGLFLDEATGCYYYYEKGKNIKFTGLYEQDGETWYVISGKVDLKYNGTYTDRTATYIIENSKVAESKNEIMLIDKIWRMVVNGKVDYNYTGIGSNENGTYYVQNGEIPFTYTGTYTDETGTYVVEKNKVRTDYTKIMLIDKVWRMVIEGKIQYDYTGIGSNENGTYYVQNGEIPFTYTGTYFEGDTAYIIEKNKVRATCNKNTTTIMLINSIWRMVINGEVDYDYTGIGTNENGTYYVQNGEIPFTYIGTYTDETGTYVVEKNKVRTDYTKIMLIDKVWRMVIEGKVQYDYTGIGSNENGSYYVQNGEIPFTYYGTYFEGDKAYILEKNKVEAVCDKNTTKIMLIKKTWRMVVNGEVDYDYTGLGTNENGTYLVQNGEIPFTYYGTYTNETGTYVVEKNKVRTEYTKIMLIDKVWRMVIEGKVQYDYTGIGSNENGSYYVQNGEIPFTYYGTYFEGDKAYILEKNKVEAVCDKNTTKIMLIKKTWRMVVNGEVDYDYTGLGTNENGTYLVQNGEIPFTYYGTYKVGDITYAIEKNKVRTEYTKVMRLDGVWRMVVKGIVDYDYTGIGTNEYGTWYIESGEVNFDYTGTYFEGTTAYIIEKGVIYVTCKNTTTEVIKINSTWRMVINGEVDYNYTGIGKNSNGIWLVENGKVTFNYNGQYTASDGSIYNIKGSKVREVLNNSKYPGFMCVDSPIAGRNYQASSLEITGWTLCEAQSDIVKIYLDNKFVANATRQSRPDVFSVYPTQFGGPSKNPNPGFYYKLSTAGLSDGKHTLTIVNLTNDGSEIIQSREVEFKIVNLAQTWGIDVSRYQGNIDWNAVRNSGVNFAIIRIGYYLESSGATVIDPYFEQNYNACKSLGIAVGGYFYSYAFNSAEASREAQSCLSIISGKSFELPIFLDVEDNILKNAVKQGRTNKNELTSASVTFCNIMNSAGYRGGVYASKSFFYDYLNVSVLEQYDIWLAHYTNPTGSPTDYTGRYDIWQYTSIGSVPGINGNVDLNWCFKRYY